MSARMTLYAGDSPNSSATSTLARCSNLSGGGLALLSPIAVGLGQSLQVELEMDNESLVVDVRVVWTRSIQVGEEIGVEFLDRDAMLPSFKHLLDVPARNRLARGTNPVPQDLSQLSKGEVVPARPSRRKRQKIARLSWADAKND
jgi:hypothetical protein